jgi:Tfp pilus assembly protein PilF
MGHEKAGDAAMRQAIDLYSKGPLEHGREAALEMFVIYALECQNPAKAEREADEILKLDPEDASSRTVKMLMSLKRGDLTGAREIARQIQSRGNEQSTPYKLADRVLAIDPNQVNTYNRAP